MLCSCCDRACIEIQCSYSINHTEPNEQNLDNLYKDGNAINLKQCHKHFTQFPMQMEVAKTKTAYIVVWTTNGMAVDNITFDKKL